jgi:hypothetical protein
MQDVSGTPIYGGASEITRAADLIAAGTPILYTGASGPCQFDAYGNTRDLYTHWTVKSGQYVDDTTFNCIAQPDMTQPNCCPIQ